MSVAMFVTWVLVGLLAGVLGSLLMKRGGHGLKTDAILGVVGSLGASWIFRGLVYSQGYAAGTWTPQRNDPGHEPSQR
jgi:uncharacterized membrane protein YeaQ/YmgE (transglycosylase-associated protein family)